MLPSTAHLYDLLRYEVWCNQQLVDAASRLTPQELHREMGVGLGTLHHTLFHIFDVLQGWTTRVGLAPRDPQWRTYDAHTDLETLGNQLARAGQGLIDAVRASDAAGVLNTERRLYQALHLVTHATHHRSQALSMLRLLGHAQPYEGGDFGGWSNRAAGTES